MGKAHTTAAPQSPGSNSEPTDQPTKRDTDTTDAPAGELLKPPVAGPLPPQFQQSLLSIARRPRMSPATTSSPHWSATRDRRP